MRRADATDYPASHHAWCLSPLKRKHAPTLLFLSQRLHSWPFVAIVQTDVGSFPLFVIGLSDSSNTSSPPTAAKKKELSRISLIKHIPLFVLYFGRHLALFQHENFIPLLGGKEAVCVIIMK